MLHFCSLIYAVLSMCYSGNQHYCESCNTHFYLFGYLFVWLFIYLFVYCPAVQMEKMELMKRERLQNHPLCHCRALPMKWSILMTGKRLMLLGNVRNTVSFLLLRWLEWLQPTSKARLSTNIFIRYPSGGLPCTLCKWIGIQAPSLVALLPIASSHNRIQTQSWCSSLIYEIIRCPVWCHC